MDNKFWLSGDTRPDLLAAHLVELRETLIKKDPDLLADITATKFVRADTR